jgi:hypothetical protein
MSHETDQAKLEQAKRLNGREVASLRSSEFYFFEDLCKQNKATRLYDGPNGLQGKAKVKIYS